MTEINFKLMDVDLFRLFTAQAGSESRPGAKKLCYTQSQKNHQTVKAIKLEEPIK
jgi:hypothetical protein